MTLGEIIKQYLDENGLSQRQFAQQCGVSYGYISMIVRGANPSTGKPLKLSINKVSAIADGMGLTLDTLLREADDFPLELNPRTDEPAEEEDEAWAIRERLRTDPNYRILFSAAETAKPEHLRAAAAMLKALEDGGK